MKVESNKTNVLQTSNVQQSTQFSIKTSAQAFSILSDKLYSNKIAAVIREYTSNAIDIHNQHGVEDPITVHLPSPLEPYFSVQDTGTGLSQEDIRNYYAVYFASKKSENNDSIGGFGLGCKAAFAYVDTFSVYSWFEGTMTAYMLTIMDGVPTVQKTKELLYDAETVPSGIRVQLAVDNDDITRFNKEAANILQWYPESQVNIVRRAVNQEVIFQEPIEIVNTDGKTFRVFKPTEESLRATEVYIPRNSAFYKRNEEYDVNILIGYSLYSISIPSKLFDAITTSVILPEHVKDILDTLSDLYGAKVKNLDILNKYIFEVPVGEYPLVPSREAIEVKSKQSHEYLSQAIEAVMVDTYLKLQKIVDGIKTPNLPEITRIFESQALIDFDYRKLAHTYIERLSKDEKALIKGDINTIKEISISTPHQQGFSDSLIDYYDFSYSGNSGVTTSRLYPIISGLLVPYLQVPQHKDKVISASGSASVAVYVCTYRKGLANLRAAKNIYRNTLIIVVLNEEKDVIPLRNLLVNSLSLNHVYTDHQELIKNVYPSYSLPAKPKKAKSKKKYVPATYTIDYAYLSDSEEIIHVVFNGTLKELREFVTSDKHKKVMAYTQGFDENLINADPQYMLPSMLEKDTVYLSKGDLPSAFFSWYLKHTGEELEVLTINYDAIKAALGGNVGMAHWFCILLISHQIFISYRNDKHYLSWEVSSYFDTPNVDDARIMYNILTNSDVKGFPVKNGAFMNAVKNLLGVTATSSALFVNRERQLKLLINSRTVKVSLNTFRDNPFYEDVKHLTAMYCNQNWELKVQSKQLMSPHALPQLTDINVLLLAARIFLTGSVYIPAVEKLVYAQDTQSLNQLTPVTKQLKGIQGENHVEETNV